MEKVKVIAMYLPQFHRVDENDKWWGEGFTEWTAVKNATSLFEGHIQPRKPQNENYYDLMDQNVMMQQSQLMKKYNVSGLCFYHYWFKDGKRILEKPSENLLSWKDVDMPFCFCWANESWGRTWSVFNDNNSWAPKFEQKQGGSDNQSGILLEQRYGTEREWREHFYYLLPFFKDSRYICINEKPIFMFYKPDLIDCLAEMLEYWNKLAVQEGLKGIYFMGTNTSKKQCLDAIYWQEPQKSQRFVQPEYKEGVCCRKYDDVWKVLLERNEEAGKVFFGGFVDYDDTPRRGNAGRVILGGSADKFKGYLKKLLKKSEMYENEYVFLNAWNEWGEGMYLEPDERNGSAYLQAIKEALEEYPDETIQSRTSEDNYWMELSEKYKTYWQILDRWLTLKENQISIAEYLKRLKINKIAVYGMGMLGKHLVEELKNTDVKIAYGIDRRAKGINAKFPVLTIEDTLPEVDAIIISVTYDYEKIVEELKAKVSMPILSLKKIIYEV